MGGVPAACQSCINITIKYLRCYEVQPSLWQVPTFSERDGIRASLLEPKKSQFAVCDTTPVLSVKKKIILSIKDKIQPSIRRTIIKGTLVWGTLIFSYIHRLGSFFGVQNFESHYFGGMKICGYFLGVTTKLDYI